jgi:hypothetical protein
VKAQRKLRAVFAAAIGLTLTSGWAYGYWTHRWGPAADMQAAAQHLQQLPAVLDDWRLASEEPLKDEIQRMLQCAGHIVRKYTNQRTGESVQVAIILGPPGPTAVHTPEICYSSRDYTVAETPQKTLLPSPASKSSFWRLTFKPRVAGGESLRVYYAWSDGENWTASSSPRFEFGGSRMLYKIQVACAVGTAESELPNDPCWSFLQSLSNSEWRLDSQEPSAS